MEEIQLAMNEVVNQSGAVQAARTKLPPDAVLLAWYDRVERTGRPDAAGPPSERYLNDYARSRGAKARVVVNERFVLFFVPGNGS